MSLDPDMDSRNAPSDIEKKKFMVKPLKKIKGPILFTLINQFTDVIGGMARRMHETHGIGSALLHTGPLPDGSVYDLSPSDFVEVMDYQAVLAPRPLAELPPLPQLIEQVELVEEKYGVRIVEMIRADRHLGQEFANGADTPASKFAARFDYIQVVDLCLRLIDYFEDVVTRVQPCLIVTAPADTARMALTAVAEAHGVPIRVLGPNHSNNGFQLRVNRHFWPGGLAEAYKREVAASAGKTVSGETEIDVRDSDRTEYARRAIRSGTSVSAPLRAIFKLFRRAAGDIAKGRKKGYGGYRFSESLASILATWRERRRQMKAQPLSERLPENLSYVFFPLVVEPETTLQCESPMSDNQLTLIDWLAKTLPAGWRLIVKEHPGFTYPRPRFFWEQIRRYPNVDIAAIYESGEAIAQKARIVAVINGTLGIQAAAGAVPVLTFNPHWVGRFLPQVAYASNYEETAEMLRFLSNEENLPSRAERRRLGDALVRALDVNSYQLTDTRILEEKALGEPTPVEDIDAIINALIDSLSGSASDATIPFSSRPQRGDTASQSCEPA